VTLKYRHIDHTADVGLVVFGGSLAQLFEHCAEGLFDVIADVSRIESRIAKTVTVQATDLEALLVTWLSELNYLFLTEQFLFGEFRVDEISETLMRAVATGEHMDMQRHEIYTEVKAVTYHQLYIRRDDTGWQAQIIFDL
jgi:SHS2 domain-containing protein